MWNTISTNKLIETRIKYNEHQKHKNSLSSVKHVLNNKCPYQPPFIVNRQKQKQSKNEMLGDIYKQNQILLSKMITIEKNPIKNLNADILQSDFRAGHVSSQSIQRDKFLKRVQKENSDIYKKMSAVQSNYSKKIWEKHKNQDIYISRNLSQNARRGVCIDYSNPKSFSNSQQNFHESRFGGSRKSLSDFRNHNDNSGEYKNNQSFKKSRPMTSNGSRSYLR